MDNQHVKQLLEENYDFRLGEYISEGFSIFGKNTGNFVVFTLLVFLISGTASAIPFIGSIINSIAISPPLWAGIAIVAHKIYTDEPYDFENFFEGFQKITPLAITAVISGLIVLFSLVPFIVVNMSMLGWDFFTEGPTIDSILENEYFFNFPTWSFLLLLPALFFSISYSWAYYFVIFYDLSPWEALEASRRMITKQWGLFFVFYLLTGLIAVVGVFGLCIGILFTVPAVICMHYVAFADVTRLNDLRDDDMDILDHLVD